MPRPLKVLWQINATDGETPWIPETRLPANFAKLQTLARQLDELGYYGALTTAREAIALVAETERLRFLVPEYPGVKPVTLLAEEAQVFDAYSQGRLLYNQINGRDAILNRYGVTLDHDTRYAYSEEYWSRFKALYNDDREAYSGEFFSYGPQFRPTHFGPRQVPHTPVWGTGKSPAGIEHAGRVLDAYLFFYAGTEQAEHDVQAVQAVADSVGRTLEYGALSSIIVRETAEEAWAEFERRLRATPADRIARDIDHYVRSFADYGLDDLTSEDPQVQRRIDALRSGRLPSIDDLRVDEVLTAGIWPVAEPAFNVLGRGSGNVLIGGPQQVADYLNRVSDQVGIDVWILQSWPHLVESRYTAELLLPLLNIDHPAPTLREPEIA